MNALGAERQACREQITERKNVNNCRYGTHCTLLRSLRRLLALIVSLRCGDSVCY
jgi:hypothetical protein